LACASFLRAILREMKTPALLLLGVGQVAKAAAAAFAGGAGGRKIIATTRQPIRAFELFPESINPISSPWPRAEVPRPRPGAARGAEVSEPLARGADVLVSFPPDGSTDAIIAPACLQSRSVVYISSTGVYGSREGTINDQTPIDDNDQHAALRIEAEKIWRSV